MRTFLVFTGLFIIVACHSPSASFSNDYHEHLVSRGRQFGVERTPYFEHFWVAGDVAGKVTDVPASLVEPLVVIIEGDGRPWRTRFQIASDPTPEKPLLLDWLAVTPHAAVYLGRPCYYGKKQLETPEPPITVKGLLPNRQCDVYWYTFGRYSPVVVSSMVDAVNKLARGRCLILLGHSGGGTLAMLMAPQLLRTKAIVTLSGNISVTEWQEYHEFTPLLGSLDPAQKPPLSASIMQVHIAAEGDRQILPEWTKQESLRQQAKFQVWPVSGHNEWQASWLKLDALIEKIKQEIVCR